MSSGRDRARGAADDEEQLDAFTEELSTFTDADAPSLVFEIGGKNIAITQVIPNASSAVRLS
jgi:hypothetical protein